MKREMIVRVLPPPQMKILKKDGRYFVRTRYLERTYRGKIPLWVVNEVQQGNFFFVAKFPSTVPEFIKKADPSQW